MKLAKGMKIHITGERNYITKTVTAEVISDEHYGDYTVLYRGRAASIREGCSMTRMNGTRCTTLLGWISIKEIKK